MHKYMSKKHNKKKTFMSPQPRKLIEREIEPCLAYYYFLLLFYFLSIRLVHNFSLDRVFEIWYLRPIYEDGPFVLYEGKILLVKAHCQKKNKRKNDSFPTVTKIF